MTDGGRHWFAVPAPPSRVSSWPSVIFVVFGRLGGVADNEPLVVADADFLDQRVAVTSWQRPCLDSAAFASAEPDRSFSPMM